MSRLTNGSTLTTSDPATLERYRSHLDIHILPRFGDTPLNGITRMAVKRWVKDLNHHRADSTVASILSLLSMIIGEAVEERRIGMNPCRRLRKGSSHRPERPWASADGGLHRRSSFHRCHWRPAIDGNPANGTPAVIRGLHFHDLRHSHKTWLIEDGVPEVAQAKRLGHRLPGVRGIYSHASSAVEQRLVDGLQARWKRHAPQVTPLPTRKCRYLLSGNGSMTC